jgi:DNA polymerase III subunit gamma/tau
MSYVVLARKWRPTSFEDLVGQEHVARTLANAIASGRIAHAFLFTGVRGVGKTTSARLLARALNCMGSMAGEEKNRDQGPTATPCLQCPACREITQGSDVDVREIDGASHNGVDEVRKLQESLPYRPTRDRYKIFIIDEVHMLSAGAWNAFLKTLEEPPPHVKFIFATTEVNKVPVTILSRVQRFDFKLIPTRLIVDRLRFVLAAEGISTDEAGLSIIARQAAGSMRDAMSLLDQVIAWNDQNLDGDSVARVLGVASRKVLHELAESVVDGKATRSLAIVEQVSQQGFDLGHVARDFLDLLRDLVVAKVCNDSSGLIDLPDEEQRDVRMLAERANADDLLRLYHGFSVGFDDVLRGIHPRGALEMLLVRLCRRPPLVPLDDLVARLLMLERRLGPGSGGATIPGGPTPSGGPARSQQQSAAPVGVNTATRPRPREERTAPQGRRSTSSGDADDEDAEQQDPYEGRTSAPNEVRSGRLERTDPVATIAAETTDPIGTPTNCLSSDGSLPNHASPDPRTRTPLIADRVNLQSNQPIHQSPERESTQRGAVVSASQPSEAETNQRHRPEPDEAELMAVWQELVERMATIRPDVSAVLEHALLLEASAERLVVGWPPSSVFCAQFENAELTDLIRAAQLERGTAVAKVLIVQNDPRAIGRDTLATRETAERTLRYRNEQATIRSHPRVKDVQEILGGRILAVKLADR